MAQLLIRDKGRLWTRNANPGVTVYGEKTRRFQGKEFRDWGARRSKLAAYLEKGGRNLQPTGDESVLYLGAASGTTVSHVSDLLPKGRIFAVEFSPRSFRDLLVLAAARSNIIPILSDAHATHAYDAYVDAPVPILVQDIAQRDQVQIFAKNALQFLPPGGLGFLAVKARSIDVAAAPRKIFDRVHTQLKEAGFNVIETVDLEPFEKDHAVLVVKR